MKHITFALYVKQNGVPIGYFDGKIHFDNWCCRSVGITKNPLAIWICDDFYIAKEMGDIIWGLLDQGQTLHMEECEENVSHNDNEEEQHNVS